MNESISMKRWLPFGVVMTLGVAALVWSERHPVEVSVTPAPILYFVADSEWELSRLPMTATRLSDQEEIEIGNRLAARTYLDRVGANVPAEERAQDQIVQDYVSQVGAKVAARAHRKLPYRFHYIRSMDFVNAFALPGGHVYIGAGLVALMDSEDELAAVLGHEIEHIDHYHCAERVQTEARLRRLPLGRLVAIPMAVFEAGYSKDQELEADREGTHLAVWAGYSPLGALRMFQTFDRLYQEYVSRARSPQEELSRVAIQTLEGYFRSHPLPSERIEQLQKMITDERWGNLTQERALAVAYVFWAERARHALAAHHFEPAANWAKRALEANADQPLALETLGRAQFAEADFEDSATAYAKARDLLPTNEALLQRYADALMARHTPEPSLQAFTGWLDAHPDLKWRTSTRMELARLTLAARGEQAAGIILFPGVAANAQALPPELRGEYGWWFYELGQYDAAAKWLSSAAQELPGDATLDTRLGWAMIEQRNLESALQFFGAPVTHYASRSHEFENDRTEVYHERRMGLVVAAWQAQQFARALSEFASATYDQPQWLNPQWVKNIYSPGVAKTIEELKREQKKRSGNPASRSN